MARTKRGVINEAKHKKVFKAVKGQYGRRKKHHQSCKASNGKRQCNMPTEIEKAKKREFRSLWIQNQCRCSVRRRMTYSRFINALAKSKIKLDRKVLAELAYNNPEVFKSIVKKVQSSLN